MIWFQGTKRGSAGSRQETVKTIIFEKVMGNLMQGGGAMIIVYLTLRYRAPWCRSLKDKRSQCAVYGGAEEQIQCVSR